MYRATKFVSAISASLVVGIPLAMIPLQNIEAAECHSRPKPATPAGQHWFYVIDRGTNRRCWHLGQAQLSSHASITRRARRAAILAARRSEPVLTQKTADAYAELGLPENGAQDAAQPAQQTLVASDYPKSVEQDKPATVAGDSPQSLVASRWPEPAGTRPVADEPPPFVVASAAPDANPGPPMERDQAPEAPPVALTSTEALPAPASIEPLLLATFAAIMLTGFAGGSVYLLVGVRRRPQVSVPRGPQWPPQLIDYSRPPAWLAPAARDASRHPRHAHVADVTESYLPTGGLDTGGLDADGLDDEAREIQQLLGRLDRH